jgi:hypothetical protein
VADMQRSSQPALPSYLLLRLIAARRLALTRSSRTHSQQQLELYTFNSSSQSHD